MWKMYKTFKMFPRLFYIFTEALFRNSKFKTNHGQISLLLSWNLTWKIKINNKRVTFNKMSKPKTCFVCKKVEMKDILHSLPTNSDLRKLWIDVCNIGDVRTYLVSSLWHHKWRSAYIPLLQIKARYICFGSRFKSSNLRSLLECSVSAAWAKFGESGRNLRSSGNQCKVSNLGEV